MKKWMTALIGTSAAVAFLVLSGATSVQASDKCTPDQQALADDIAAQVAAMCPCPEAEPGKPWKNHGRYVSCVATNTNILFKQSDVARSCKRGIRRCAARSTCGKPGAVRCCLTKDRECIGDTLPGDLNPDGHCERNVDLACDTNADCAETKCKIQRDTDRCLAKGGVDNGTGSCCGGCSPQ